MTGLRGVVIGLGVAQGPIARMAEPLPAPAIVEVDDIVAEALDRTRLAAETAGITVVAGGEHRPRQRQVEGGGVDRRPDADLLDRRAGPSRRGAAAIVSSI